MGMMWRVGVLASIVAMTLLVTAPKVAAQSVSQIVLSCSTPPPQSQSPNGCRSSELAPPPTGTPPIIVGNTLEIVGGFWIWCQNPNGGTPYGSDCTGSVYVEEVNLVTNAAKYHTTAIAGGATATGPTGITVSFNSTDGDLSCTLNVPASPTKGGTNTLSGLCNGVPITFYNTVVQVTR